MVIKCFRKNISENKNFSCIFVYREIVKNKKGRIKEIKEPVCALKLYLDNNKSGHSKGINEEFIKKMLKKRQGNGWWLPKECEYYKKYIKG